MNQHYGFLLGIFHYVADFLFIFSTIMLTETFIKEKLNIRSLFHSLLFLEIITHLISLIEKKPNSLSILLLLGSPMSCNRLVPLLHYLPRKPSNPDLLYGSREPQLAQILERHVIPNHRVPLGERLTLGLRCVTITLGSASINQQIISRHFPDSPVRYYAFGGWRRGNSTATL